MCFSYIIDVITPKSRYRKGFKKSCFSYIIDVITPKYSCIQCDSLNSFSYIIDVITPKCQNTKNFGVFYKLFRWKFISEFNLVSPKLR